MVQTTNQVEYIVNKQGNVWLISNKPLSIHGKFAMECHRFFVYTVRDIVPRTLPGIDFQVYIVCC